MLNQFLWIIYLYLCVTIFIVGHIARYRYDQFSWTTKSSEFLEEKQFKWGSLLFHLGVIPAFFGHVVGLAIPAEWIDELGISKSTYHLGAAYTDSIFDIVTLIGVLLLTARRLTISNVRKLGSASDIFADFLLILVILMGCFSALVTNAVVADFDYRQTISIWFRHSFTFSPNAALVTGVPSSFKIHILLGFAILACWLFTRLVHVWSVPLTYTNRRYIIYRKHKAPRAH